MNFDEARSELQRIREDGSRDSEMVVDVWENCLNQLCYKLGDEVWIVYEQVFLAALDCCRLNVADRCLSELRAQFPTSLRIRRLIGMRYEAIENWDKAKSVYENILKEEEHNTVVRKRLIAILKAQGRSADAIKELTHYLEMFQSDYDAWLELCDLYLADADYHKAAFCMEEVLLSQPHNHLYHQRYAEIRYTEGGTENMELAKAYFSQAVKLNSNNMRALYGLFLSSNNLAQSNKAIAKNRKEHLSAASWAASQIAERYDQLNITRSSINSSAYDELTDHVSNIQGLIGLDLSAVHS